MTLTEYLPQGYKASPEVMKIQIAMGEQSAALWAARDGLMAQLVVSTATWGLDAWEHALGLAVDTTKPADYRRTRVMSKLRGQGTTTAAMVRSVAESFSGGQVDVIETPAGFRFTVKFIGALGVPPNLNDLTAAIEEIKPAHLAYAYAYTYRTYGQMAPYTHGHLSAYTHSQLREGTIDGD